LNKRIYLSPPHVGMLERELLLEAFDSNWIAPLGPQVDLFEQEMCKKLNAPAAIALSSGTAGLHLALLLLGVGREDVVLCSTWTFAATAFAITYVGATPVFVDSDSATWNMNPDLLEEELDRCNRTNRLPRAVVVVDIYGQTADYQRIRAACARYDIPLIEDAAEALGATYDDQPAGTLGDMGVLSFNGNKIITTSGGGMLLTQTIQEATRARFLASQAKDPLPYYQHSVIGYNYRMSNLLAAVGRAQLASLDSRIRRRKEINNHYRRILGDYGGLSFMPEAPYGRPNHWLTCVVIDKGQTGLDPEDLRTKLEARNIESRRLWKPMHMQPVFADCRYVGGSVSAGLFDQGLCLPSGSSLSDQDLSRVSQEFSVLLD